MTPSLRRQQLGCSKEKHEQIPQVWPDVVVCDSDQYFFYDLEAFSYEKLDRVIIFWRRVHFQRQSTFISPKDAIAGLKKLVRLIQKDPCEATVADQISGENYFSPAKENDYSHIGRAIGLRLCCSAGEKSPLHSGDRKTVSISKVSCIDDRDHKSEVVWRLPFIGTLNLNLI